MTSDSFHLMLDMVAAQHRNQPVDTRKRLSKNTLEEKAEICAAAIAFGDELQQSVPNISTYLEKHLPHLPKIALSHCALLGRGGL